MKNKENTSRQQKGWAAVHLLRRQLGGKHGFKRLGKMTWRQRIARILQCKPAEVTMSNHKFYRAGCHQYNSRRGVLPLEALVEDPLAGRLTRVDPGPWVGQEKRAMRRAQARAAGTVFEPLLAD